MQIKAVSWKLKISVRLCSDLIALADQWAQVQPKDSSGQSLPIDVKLRWTEAAVYLLAAPKLSDLDSSSLIIYRSNSVLNTVLFSPM